MMPEREDKWLGQCISVANKRVDLVHECWPEEQGHFIPSNREKGKREEWEMWE